MRISVHPKFYDKLKAASEDAAPSVRRWLRVGAAATDLGIGVSTMNKMRIYGGGPPYAKIGQAVIYDPADLDIFAAERKVRSTSEPVRAA